MMTQGQKAAFCRVVLRGRHPLLACHDLGVTPADFIDALFEDAPFARDALTVIVVFSKQSFEERFNPD